MLLLLVSIDILFFFFSSRRRHTRSKRDWSSDVCSSDLLLSLYSGCLLINCFQYCSSVIIIIPSALHTFCCSFVLTLLIPDDCPRSEERRVGKELRTSIIA